MTLPKGAAVATNILILARTVATSILILARTVAFLPVAMDHHPAETLAQRSGTEAAGAGVDQEQQQCYSG